LVETMKSYCFLSIEYDHALSLDVGSLATHDDTLLHAIFARLVDVLYLRLKSEHFYENINATHVRVHSK